MSCNITYCIFNNASHSKLLACLILFALFLASVVGCPNGCSSRGLCVAGVCQCAEGLTGADCSSRSSSFSSIPTPFQCPSCYATIVGPAVYYWGPSWSSPDGPIVALNYQGNLSVLQGNADADILASGLDVEDWETSPIQVLVEGPDFDQCGAWLMRAFASNGSVVGFYHAERACDYSNNGQTRKSAGVAVSPNGFGFTKPNYPNNKIVDTNTTNGVGYPTGEGDYGVVEKDGFYYMYFSNVEDDTFGVARSPVSSGGVPGSWLKYYQGSWNQPGLGGLSTPTVSLTGTQAYLHTPSDSILSVGGRDAYFQTGTALSASDDTVNFTFVADPLLPGDFATNKETILYQSLFGQTGGYDVGTNFDLYYLWVPPDGSYDFRFQIRRSVTFQYVGPTDSNAPSTRLALTQYTNRVTGERWESIQLPTFPYMPTGIIGYVLTRPTINAFPVYECYNYNTLDYFVGTGDECFATNVNALRVLGHMWSIRVARSIAVYRCSASNDTFLSTAQNCNGQAPAATRPFGYVMDGPAISASILNRDILIGQGSTWNFTSGSTPPTQFNKLWTALTYDDSSWNTSTAPFGTGYSSFLLKTSFGPRDYFFRRNFTVAAGRKLERLVCSVASDDYALIYINGVLIDSDIVTHHEASYWNRQVFVPLDLINTTGPNIAAVVVRNGDQWAFFDMQISARYTEEQVVTPAACANDCGIKGQCIAGTCVCESGWTGFACNTSLCSYSQSVTATVLAQGTSWRHTQWNWVPSTPANFFAPTYDDSWWHLDSAPFGTSEYSYTTWVPAIRHLYRKKFLVDVPFDQVIANGTISIASAANHRIWLNGVFLGQPLYPAEWHTAKYWNAVITVNGKLFSTTSNIIAVEVTPGSTAFFDLKIAVTYAARTCTVDTSTTTAAASTSTTAAAGSTGSATTAPSTTTGNTTANTTQGIPHGSGNVSSTTGGMSNSTGAVNTASPTATPTPLPVATTLNVGDNLEPQSSDAVPSRRQDSCIFVITLSSLLIASVLI